MHFLCEFLAFVRLLIVFLLLLIFRAFLALFPGSIFDRLVNCNCSCIKSIVFLTCFTKTSGLPSIVISIFRLFSWFLNERRKSIQCCIRIGHNSKWSHDFRYLCVYLSMCTFSNKFRVLWTAGVLVWSQIVAWFQLDLPLRNQKLIQGAFFKRDNNFPVFGDTKLRNLFPSW